MSTAFNLPLPAATRGGVVLGGPSMPSPGNRVAWDTDSEASYFTARLYNLLPDAMDGKPVDLANLARDERGSELLRRRIIELLIDRACGNFMLPEPGRRWLFRTAELYGEWGRLRRIASAVRPSRGASLYVPDGANDEFRTIQARARTDLCALVVNIGVQSLYVEDYRAAPAAGDEEADNDDGTIMGASASTAWATWKRNRMMVRQHGVHRTVLTCGYSYMYVDVDKRGRAIYVPWSPLRTFAWYPEDWTDEDPSMIQAWPGLVLRLDRPNRISVYDGYRVWRWRIVDDHYEGGFGEFKRLRLVNEIGSQEYPAAFRGGEEHAHPPVVRLVGRTDLIGDPVGIVEPTIPMQQRVEETVFGSLLAQTYAAFRQRWAAGMVPRRDADGNEIPIEIVPYQSLLTSSSPDTRFGEFGQTDLRGFSEMNDQHIRFGAAVAQAPPQAIHGSMDNVGADGLAAAEVGHQRQNREFQDCLGEGWAQMLREGARAEGEDEPDDVGSEVIWRDTEARSLQSMAQALGTLSSTLGVPQRALWRWLPGVGPGEIREWTRLADEEAARSPFAATAADIAAMRDAPETEPGEELDGPGTERR